MTNFRRATFGPQARTLDGRYYASDEIYRLEAERIFGRHWLAVGRGEQVREGGDYVLVDWGDENVIILRDRAGTARAFYNVCRHRGSRLCQAESGRLAETIQCPYHAWTYALDGKLVSARLMQEVEGFRKEDYPLVPVPLVEWEGFLFLSFAPAPRPFEHVFAPIMGKFAAWDLAQLRVGRRISYEVRANWKQIFENYSECYHCPLIHPALDRLSPSNSGRNDLDEGLFLGGYMTLNEPGGSLTASGHTSRPALGAVGGEDLGRVYYYSIFPNMLLGLHPDYVLVHTLRPLGARRTKLDCEWLFDPVTMARPEFDPSDAVEFWDMTNRQDWHACEQSQLGLRSRVYTPGPYAHSEGLLAAFDREYLRQLGEGQEV